MENGGKSARDPAIHQPFKAELEKSVRVKATPEGLAWT